MVGLLSMAKAQCPPAVISCAKSVDYNFDEGPCQNMCDNDCQCDNVRTCSEFGFCQYLP
jgi:hypothetical protein